MSHTYDMSVQPRETKGSNAAGRVRRAGLVPAVVYGGGREPEGVQVDPRAIDAVLHSELGLNTLIHLHIGDRELKRMVMMREIQRHPVTERVIHVDFVRVEMDRKIEVAVPILLQGIPTGVKNEGGLLEQVHRTVLIRVLPANIPETIEADISELHTGQHLAAGDLAMPEGAELAAPANEVIVTVLGRGGDKQEEAPAEEAEAAPETPTA